MIRKILATVAMTGLLAVASVTAAAPALACGTTPGFCPNPPWVAGTGGDW